jgi:hypothetical protein
MSLGYQNLMTIKGDRMRLASLSGLAIEASTNSTDGVLGEFYHHYDAAFILQKEKEQFDGFAKCLALNSGEAYIILAERFGPFSEFVLIARDPQADVQIGGANFIAFPLQLEDRAKTTILSLNLNYIFVNKIVRRRGYFRRLVRDLPDLAFRLLSATAHGLPKDWAGFGEQDGKKSPPTLMFIEQNDPYRMSHKDYKLDSTYTALDQIERIAIWARLGARIVDFSYVQPPLRSNQSPDDTLVCGVVGAQANALSACLLHAHLQRFFGISVLKGRDPSEVPVAAKQLWTLQDMCARNRSIALLAADNIRMAPQPTWPQNRRGSSSLRVILKELS